MNPTTEQVHSGRVILAPVDAAPASGRRAYDCVFMQPGLVRRNDGSPSNWLIPAQAIATAAPLFDAVACHIDHPALFGFGWRGEPSVKDIAGVTFSPAWDEDEQVLRGGIRLYDTGPGTPAAFLQALMDQMLADRAQGLEVPGVGLSATLYHLCEEDDEESDYRVTREIVHVESMDTVYAAGAGGYVRAALSAAGYEEPGTRRVWAAYHTADLSTSADTSKTILGGTTMQDQELQNDSYTASSDSHHTDSTGPLPPAPQPPPTPEPDPLAAEVSALSSQVQQLTTALASAEAERTVEGMGEQTLTAGFTGREEFEVALDCLLAGIRPPQGVRPLSGIREAYMMLSGDYEMTGLFHSDRVHLANVTTTTMAGLVANALNKRVVNLFQEYPEWWGPAVTPEDFATLQDVRWITLGGVGELPTVAEGAAYTEMTWDDQTETDEFVKKGGYLGITLETIDKDDTRKVQAAPRALAQAAWLTLGKSISAIFTASTGTGPTMSDATVLFTTGHGNLLTAALSWGEYDTVKNAMMKQTELNSGERLGALTRPYLLWVPIDMETKALQIMASEGEPGTADNDINPFAEGEGREARLAVARRRVIVCPFWTDVNNWAAQANPQLYPSIGLGFRFGRTPEIFSVASPTAGLMFSNDTLPVKVRFFYAVGPTDWRGLHKSNVA